MPILDEDLVRVRGARYDKWERKAKPGVIRLLYWGDDVELVDLAENEDPERREVRVRLPHPAFDRMQEGVIRKRKEGGEYVPLRFRPADDRLLEVTFVDVQQGDATVIRTPKGRNILIDGGEEKFIARLLAATFPFTRADNPLVLDALVITHGDADHFEGLLELARAADYDSPRKQIHAKVLRYVHNGLVKRPGSIQVDGERLNVGMYERFGRSVRHDGEVYILDLWDDPRDAPDANEPFMQWRKALDRLTDGVDQLNGAARLSDETLPVVQRVEFGDDHALRTFRDDGLEFQILGPITDTVENQPALEYLRDEDGSQSVSHTINGHSVVLRMRYGNVRFMLGGDLNTHAEERLLEKLGDRPGEALQSEILKVPHHGSHEFDQRFLSEVAPVASIVSSGDENRMKEYVHPRANLMAALGRAARGPEPLVFSTELAAFFAYRGPMEQRRERDENGEWVDLPESHCRGPVHAFERLVFGAVRVRTDGERLLIAVGSASDNIKEAYAFKVDAEGNVERDEFRVI